jgi:hypothetical protein
MVCLFHGDYGPPDPAIAVGETTTGASSWPVDVRVLREARNLGEAEAIQRHVLHGDAVSWCEQGYAWVEQDAIGWLYIAVMLLVVAPYLIARFRVADALSRSLTVGRVPSSKSTAGNSPVSTHR